MYNRFNQLMPLNKRVPTAVMAGPIVDRRCEAGLIELLIDRTIRSLADGSKKSGRLIPVLSIDCVALSHCAAMPRCLGCWR